MAKQPQSISNNGVGLGNNIQVCSTAQNVSFCTRSEPQVTTAISTPLTSIFSQLSLPLLVQSLTSAGPAASSGSMQSVLNSLISPKPLTSSVSQISMLTQQSTQGTLTYNAKPTSTKSDCPFFLVLLTNRIKKCSGCHGLFRDNGEMPTFILGHMERDWYPQNGQWNLGKLQNKYYHLSKTCIHT